jgi:hypothetical protein
MSNRGCLFNGRNQTCDLLVSNNTPLLIVHSDISHRQDLNSSVMTGSSRIFDHTTFAELQWKRDPFSPNTFILPPGFQKRSHLMTKEFVEVLKDVHALQCIRDSAHFEVEDIISMAQVDDHQASIQSRLVSLPINSFFFWSAVISQHICARLCCAASFGGLQSFW